MGASGLRISESCCAATTLRRFEERPMPTECSTQSLDFGAVGALQRSPHQDRHGVRLSGRPRLGPRRYPPFDSGVYHHLPPQATSGALDNERISLWALK